MSQPGKWWVGLLPLAIVWIAANWFKAEAVERDIATVGARLDHALKQLPGGVRLAQADIVPLEVKPYVWSATSDGRMITLGGVVPDGVAKAGVLAAAAKAFPAASVDDGTQIARGAPQGDFEKVTSFALDTLAQLVSGKAILSDQTLSIEGIGQREVTIETIARNAKAGLPSGFNLIVDGVMPAPVKPFTLRMEKTAGGISAVGFAPAIPARNAVITAVRNFNQPTVVDVKLASGLPAGVDYTAATDYALAQLAAMKTGVAVFTDGELSISGETADASAEAALARLRGSVPAGVKLGVLDIRSAVVP